MSDYRRLIADHLNATGFRPPGEHAVGARWYVGLLTGSIEFGVSREWIPPDWATEQLKSIMDHVRNAEGPK